MRGKSPRSESISPVDASTKSQIFTLCRVAWVATTLVAYLVIYAALLLAYISVLVYLASRKAKGGVKAPEAGRPVSGAVQSLPAE